MSRCRCCARLALVATVTSATLAACTGGTDQAGERPVLATTSIWADVTSELTCGDLQVTPMIPPGADAHSYEPSVHDADLLLDAELVVANGLRLEEGLHDALGTAAADGVRVFEVAPEVLGGTGQDDAGDHLADEDHGHDHAEGDPHIWMDPELVAAAVPHLAEALAASDPEGVDDQRIQSCAEGYLSELEDLVADMERLLGSVPTDRRSIVTNHESLGHFAERFGFEVVGTVIPSTDSLAETNARDLDDLEATMRREGVDVVFAETEAANDLAASLAGRLGEDASVVQLHTESLSEDGPNHYLAMMRRNAELVAGALGGDVEATGRPG